MIRLYVIYWWVSRDHWNITNRLIDFTTRHVLGWLPSCEETDEYEEGWDL